MGEAPTTIDPGNAEQARAWDGDEGIYWAEHAGRFDRAVAVHHHALLDAAAIGAADRTLDIGCGAGRTTLDAARAAADGSALGIDLSRALLDVARTRAAGEGASNVEFVVGDAQIHPFTPSSVDLLISRTGAMFFADPVGAFRNLGQALRPGGRAVLLTWRPFVENEWIREFSAAMGAGRGMPAPPPDAPGPFSLSDPRRARAVLEQAGFTAVELDPLDAPMWFGESAADAHGFLSGLMGWMLEGLDGAGRAQASESLWATLERHHGSDGVVYQSAAWVIAAVRP